MRVRRITMALVGVGAVLLASFGLAGVAQAAPPGNDAFASATSLPGASGSTTGTITDATVEGGEPTNLEGDSINRSVWYSWVAPSDGTLVVSTIGSPFDSAVAVYEGGAVGSLSLLSARGSTGMGDDGRVQADVTSGVTYRIQVGGGSGESGQVKLAWRMASAPANDDFEDAQVIPAAGGVVTGTNVAATAEQDEPTGNDDPEHTVWYRWTAPSDELVTFDTVGSDFDTIMAVYEGSSFVDLDLIEDNDDNGGTTLASRTVFRAIGGDTYYVQVDGYHDGDSAQIGSIGFAVNRRTFSDVSRSHPFWNEVEFVNAGAITTGYPDGTFRPASNITRAAMSAFLFRLEWADDYVPPATASFSDVPTSHPFFTEIEWMEDEGITEGYQDGTYRPQASVTRGAMSAFIYRFDNSSFTGPGTPTFSDVPTDHPFYDEVEWMNEEDITTGYEDDTFRPGANVSRGAMAAFLFRYDHGPILAL